MQILSVSVGLPREIIDRRGKVRLTGIGKAPVQGVVRVSTQGLEGDGQADRSVHGGEFRAVYVYPALHYRAWAEEEDRTDLEFGMFGENLTVDGTDERAVHIGDRFRVGGTRLEVTHPRIPCVKLGIRFNDPTFPDRFLASRRTGFFLRVLGEGPVAPGDSFELESHGPGRFTVRETLELFHGADPDRDRLVEIAALDALPPEWRDNARRRAGNA